MKRQNDLSGNKTNVGWFVVMVLMVVAWWTISKSLLMITTDEKALLIQKQAVASTQEPVDHAMEKSSKDSEVTLPTTAETLGVQVGPICQNLRNIRRSGNFSLTRRFLADQVQTTSNQRII